MPRWTDTLRQMDAVTRITNNIKSDIVTPSNEIRMLGFEEWLASGVNNSNTTSSNAPSQSLTVESTRVNQNDLLSFNNSAVIHTESVLTVEAINVAAARMVIENNGNHMPYNIYVPRNDGRQRKVKQVKDTIEVKPSKHWNNCGKFARSNIT